MCETVWLRLYNGIKLISLAPALSEVTKKQARRNSVWEVRKQQRTEEVKEKQEET